MKLIIMLIALLSLNASATISWNHYQPMCSSAVEYLNFNEMVNGNYDQRYDESICDLVRVLIHQESRGNKKAFNPEKTGSYGLLQIQCATAVGLGLTGPCSQLFNPFLNIKLGVMLISRLKQRYTLIKDVIAAYNAGRVIRLDSGYVNEIYVNQVYSRLVSSNEGNKY